MPLSKSVASALRAESDVDKFVQGPYRLTSPAILYWYCHVSTQLEPVLVHDSVILRSPPAADRLVGAPGTPATGRAVLVAAAPLPDALTARTAKVYSVLLVRFVTVWDVVDALLFGTSTQVVPPSLLYCHFWMLELLGFVQDSATLALDGAAVRFAGAAGTAMGVADTSPEASPLSALLTARILKVYDVPFVRGVTV